MKLVLGSTSLRSATIHVAPGAAAPVRFAAEALQRYLQRMGAERLSIIDNPALHPAQQLVLATAGAGAEVTPLPGQAAPGAYAMLPGSEQVALAAGSARALLSATYAL